jgi:DNA-binding XRE family transcriptional regulator
MEVDVNKLKELRLNQGLSTRALAEPAGLAPTTV